eukprot:1703389-Pyramimonas_sp.AAC.1
MEAAWNQWQPCRLDWTTSRGAITFSSVPSDAPDEARVLARSWRDSISSIARFPDATRRG